jgi:hypothetical protein
VACQFTFEHRGELRIVKQEVVEAAIAFLMVQDGALELGAELEAGVYRVP